MVCGVEKLGAHSHCYLKQFVLGGRWSFWDLLAFLEFDYYPGMRFHLLPLTAFELIQTTS